MTPSIAGSKLSAKDIPNIIRSGGNFSLGRVEFNVVGGGEHTIVFDPPYHLENGDDYAFYVPSDGTYPQLWEIQPVRGTKEWEWVCEAKRADQIAADRATRH